MTHIATHHSVPVLGRANGAAGLILQGVAVATGLASDAPRFASLAALLVTLTDHLTVLQTKQTAATGAIRSTSATKERNKAMKPVRDDLTSICHGVHLLCIANPDDAPTLIVKAGYREKKHTVSERAAFSVKNGELGGSVIGRVKAPARKYVVDWSASGDGGKTWVTDSGDKVSYTFLGLVVGVVHQFRYRTKIRGKVSEWSNGIPLMVK